MRGDPGPCQGPWLSPSWRHPVGIGGNGLPGVYVRPRRVQAPARCSIIQVTTYGDLGVTRGWPWTSRASAPFPFVRDDRAGVVDALQHRRLSKCWRPHHLCASARDDPSHHHLTSSRRSSYSCWRIAGYVRRSPWASFIAALMQLRNGVICAQRLVVRC